MKRTLTTLLFLATLCAPAFAQDDNVNHAVDGAAVASASSEYSADYPAYSAIDGERAGELWGDGGGWKGSLSAWFRVDFNRAGPVSVGRVIVYSAQSDNPADPVTEPTNTQTCTDVGLTNFEVQTLDVNGLSWTTRATVSRNSLCKRVVTFPPVPTNAVRVVINVGRDDYARITELEIFSR